VSYSQDLATKHSNDCRTVLQSEWYREIFPKTRIDSSKNTEAEFMTTARGFRLATSVGGTLTGRGGNLIIIDDPTKPADAMSQAVREKTIEWCDTTLLTRLDRKDHDAMILVMQRLHVDDLAGHFMQQGSWEHLNLPAIAEIEQTIALGPGRRHIRKVGDVLHPARESEDVLRRMKVEMGSAIFAAQYQQSPVPPSGNMINWDWFSWYQQGTPLELDEVVISWDTANKATELSDYSVGTVWGRKGEFFYLLDLIRGRFDYPNLRRKVLEVYAEWQIRNPTLLIEEAGSGISLLQDLHYQHIAAVAIKPAGDKIVRMSAQSAKIEAGAVHLPRGASWLGDLKTEILAFPCGTHDDQVDSIAQALAHMTRPRRRFLFASV